MLSKVSILVPLPIAGANEQKHNAQILEKAGSAIVIGQKGLTAKSLVGAIEDLDINHNEFTQKAIIFSKSLNLNAAGTLKEKVLKSLKDA